MLLSKWFIPHRDTHKKAHLLSLEALALYLFLFVLLQASFKIISFVKPGVLGTSSNITIQRVIELTNAERAKQGLGPLVENSALDSAATSKAANMFSENYWAHFSPSGKKPWDFISASGYRFTFAGENLAKNFEKPEDVVAAWVNSPTHRENLLNPKYSDIGIAVEDGVINGQKTTLVVQMFGTTSPLASLPSGNGKLLGNALKVEPKQPEGNIPSVIPTQTTGVQNESNALINPLKISKFFGLLLTTFIGTLLLIDLYVLKRRGVFRIASHHVAHMAILGVAATVIYTTSGGDISNGLSFIYGNFR